MTGKLKAEGNVLRMACDNADDPDYPPGKPQNRLDFTYLDSIDPDQPVTFIRMLMAQPRSSSTSSPPSPSTPLTRKPAATPTEVTF